jgi:exopolysaccharide biosynthesis polyprenyl glycosylphosphotransferase
MSVAELRGVERPWIPQVIEAPGKAHARAERLLPIAAALCWLIGDLAIVFGAFMAAHWLRFVLPGDPASALGMEIYVRQSAIVAVTTAVLCLLQGFYDDGRLHGGFHRLHHLTSAVSSGLAFALVISFLEVGDQSLSRIWLASGWTLAIAGLVVWRTVADRVLAIVRQAVAPADRVLIVGANSQGEEIARELAERYSVLGYVDNGSDLAFPSELPLLGPIAEIEHLVHDYAVNELIIALPANRREQVARIIERGFRRRVHVKFLPDMGELLPDRFEVHQHGSRRYIGFAPAARVSWLKRALDLVLTAGGLLALSPVLLTIALLIKLDSPGPIFYAQERVGRHGRRFRMLKFRSMRRDADKLLVQLRDRNEAIGPLFKMRADPRVTRIGRVLRRLSIDELPQLINVLRGEMSLVGPRPPLPSEVAEYEEWQFGRLRAVPGLTGLWQVSGRSDVPFHDMVRLDLHYIRNWSLSLDMKILLRTIPAVLSSRGAY